MQEQQTQAMILQQPKDSMLVVKVKQDTDWIAIGALLISFLAFLVTIYVVRKSTESQIQSNKELIQSQKNLQLIQIKATHRQDWINRVREIFIEVLDEIETLGVDFLYYIDLKDINITEYQIRIEKNLSNLQKNYFSLRLYLNDSESTAKIIFDVLDEVKGLFIEMFNNYGSNKDDFESKFKEINLYKMRIEMRKLLKQEWNKIKEGE